MDIDDIDHDKVKALLLESLVDSLRASHPDKSEEEIEAFATEMMDLAEEQGRRLKEARARE